MSLSFPLFLTYGAGTPSTSGGATNDIAGIVAAGASGIRMGIVWSAADSTASATTVAQLNASYMAKISAVVKYCNSQTLLAGTIPMAGIPGLAVDLQVAAGSKYGGQMYNENAGGINVPHQFAIFSALVAEYFKKVGGVYPNGQVWGLELGNEPNHAKWDDGVASGIAKDKKGLAYVKCMARFSAPAKTANPDVVILLGGLGGHADSVSDQPTWDFTQNMYDARFTTGGYDGHQAPTGIHGLVDQTNTHPYSYMATPTQDLKLAATATRAGDVANLTTVAAGSNGVNTSTFRGAGVLHLTSTATLTYGVVQVATNSGPALITYTGVSGNDLTGCETMSGGGVLATGGTVKKFVSDGPNGARGWFQFCCLTRPIIAAGGGHSDALDPTLPILITEFGQPCPAGSNTIGDACVSLASACAEWESYSWAGSLGSPLSWFCWQDKDETNLPLAQQKGRWYGIVGVGKNQWVGDTVAFGHKADATGDLWQTFHDIATAGGTTGIPTVSGLSPTHGTASGGTTVTITGTKFTTATAVQFDAVPATSFSITDSTHINAVSPAGTGSADVTVTNPKGTSPVSAAGVYTYDAVGGVPTVTGLSPTGGPTAGGTTVTVSGTNFTGTTAVKFGGTPATSFSVTNPTTISAVAPAGTGVARVKVTNATGTSIANDPADQYTYTGPAPGLGWGLNVSATYSGSNPTNVATNAKSLFTAASSTDERIMRIQPEWGYAQSTFTGTAAGQNDSFVWDRVNAIVDAQAAAGNRILWVIGYTPAGLQQPIGKGDKCFPNRDAAAGYRDVANYAWALVNHAETRSPGVTKAVEVWNEPSGTFLYPISVANYTAMLRACYTAIKTGAIAGRATRTAYPSILVGTGGISPETAGSNNAADAWHAGICFNGGTNSFDWAGHHPYNLSCPPTANKSWNQRLHVLPQLRAVLDGVGRTDAEIWLTEDGFFNRPDSTPTDTTGAHSVENCSQLGFGDPQGFEIKESVMGTRIGELLTWWNANRVAYKLGKLIYFELEHLNNNSHPGDWSDHAGLFAYDTGHNGAALTTMTVPFIAALGSGGTSRTAPTCNITVPSDDPTHAVPLKGLVTFLIPSTDTVDPPQNLVVKLYRDNGATLVGAATWNSFFGWYYQLDTTTLADADYVFAAKATNSASLTTTSNQPNGIRARITNAGTTNNPPVGSFVSLTGSDHVVHTLPTAAPLLIKNDPAVTIECLATDDADATVTVEVFAGPFSLGIAVPKVGAANHYVLTFDSKSLPNGVESLTGQATDSGGQIGTWP